MSRSKQFKDLQHLARAYGLLAGTCDSERVIAGTISRRWIAAEVEHAVPLAALPRALFDTQRGRDLLATELFEDQNLDPESINLETIDINQLGAGHLINSNRIPKLEPRIHVSVLVANILTGVRLYGNHGKGVKELDNDIVVAAMIQDTLGKPYLFSSLSSDEYELVDDEYLNSWFGPRIAKLTIAISDAMAEFEHAVEQGVTPQIADDECMHTVLAAICCANLRLTARAAGDGVIAFLDPCLRAELEDNGVELSSEFPERPFLQRDYNLAHAAFELSGVDHYALREPLRNTLMIAVEDVLADESKRTRLSGRRGKAVHEVHLNLPMMEYFVAAEAPNSIETVHLASLEIMRSLDKGRRKSLSTMTAHAFRICALAERLLGDALEPLVVSLAMLHDVVEDGSRRVTGYDHSLKKIMFRFGGPIAAMVSELTDETSPRAGLSSAAQGAYKARRTLNHPHLISPERHYNVTRFTEIDLKPTNRRQPYTLSGIVVKLLDTLVSLEEGIRDPELLTGWWRHSGARIFWAENMRGQIVNPLIERVLQEMQLSQTDPGYDSRPHRVPQKRLEAGKVLLDSTLNYFDLYATQNLAILADEYDLDDGQRDFLIRAFNDANIDETQFCESVLQELLTEDRLQQSIQSGRVPGRAYVTLYPKGVKDSEPMDTSTFLSYRASALRRKLIRAELGSDTADRIAALELRNQQVLAMYDQKMRGKQPDYVPSHELNDLVLQSS